MTFSKKTAIILFNLGGPNNQEAVKPFLFNLFNDKAIIGLPQPFRFLLAKLISSRRKKKAQGIYEEIGGKSPILEITQAQADALSKELSFHGDFKVFIAMRYWHPFSQEVVQKIHDYEPDQAILLPLYPQFSTTTSESSIEDFLKKLQKSGVFPDLGTKKGKFGAFLGKKSSFDKILPTKVICCYPTQENFVFSHANLIVQKIAQAGIDLKETRILFSAHGLPQKIVDAGDPYVFQVGLSVDLIVSKIREMLKISKIDHKICFQSKVGPLKWTSPSLEHELRRVAIDGKAVLVVPIAFVGEHSETLVELDIEYKELADEIGIKKYERVGALNVDGNFIAGLANMCLNFAKNGECGVGCGGGKMVCGGGVVCGGEN
jgi:ferrochelatase